MLWKRQELIPVFRVPPIVDVVNGDYPALAVCHAGWGVNASGRNRAVVEKAVFSQLFAVVPCDDRAEIGVLPGRNRRANTGHPGYG